MKTHEDPRYKYELLPTIQKLHASVTGSSDWCISEEEIGWLKYRAHTWNTGKASSLRYDLGVRGLLIESLRELEAKE